MEEGRSRFGPRRSGGRGLEEPAGTGVGGQQALDEATELGVAPTGLIEVGGAVGRVGPLQGF